MTGHGASERACDPEAAVHLSPPHAHGRGISAIKAAPDAPEPGGGGVKSERKCPMGIGQSQSEHCCSFGSTRLSDGSFGSCIPETPSPVSVSSVLDVKSATCTQHLFHGEPIAAEGDTSTKRGGRSCMDEAELARGLVGRAIRKLFPNYGRFVGVISSFDAMSGMFTITYEDEDKEEMSMLKIARYLPKEESRMVREWLASQTVAEGRVEERQHEASQCPIECPVTGLPINDKLLNKLRNTVQVTKGTLTNALHNRLGWPPEVCMCVCVCARARACVCACVRVRARIYISCMYTSVCVCVCARAYIHIMYVYKHIIHARHIYFIHLRAMRIHLQINKEEGERDEKKRQARIYNAKIHI